MTPRAAARPVDSLTTCSPQLRAEKSMRLPARQAAVCDVFDDLPKRAHQDSRAFSMASASM